MAALAAAPPALFRPNLTSKPLLSFAKFRVTRFVPRCLAVAVSVAGVGAVAAVADEPVAPPEESQGRKLYLTNLHWESTAEEIEKLFGECGEVKEVKIAKLRNGKSRGFAFVTMATEEEAHAAVEKLNSSELMGRTIRVEISRQSTNKPTPPQPPQYDPPVEERYKLYVSNLAWKVRSTDLKEFFAAKFNPLSARVVFERSPSGRSAGYGFVAFASQEEADSAIAELDGKELMGRPIRLKISHATGNRSVSGNNDSESTQEELINISS